MELDQTYLQLLSAVDPIADTKALAVISSDPVKSKLFFNKNKNIFNKLHNQISFAYAYNPDYQLQSNIDEIQRLCRIVVGLADEFEESVKIITKAVSSSDNNTDSTNDNNCLHDDSSGSESDSSFLNNNSSSAVAKKLNPSKSLDLTILTTLSSKNYINNNNNANNRSIKVRRSKSVTFNKSDFKEVCLFKKVGSPLDINNSPTFFESDCGSDTSSIASVESFGERRKIDNYKADPQQTHPNPPLPTHHKPQKDMRMNLLNFKLPVKCGLNFKLRLEHLNILKRPTNIPDPLFIFTGSVIVHNFTFQKRVFLRYTWNNWTSISELDLTYQKSINLEKDQFHFKFPITEHHLNTQKTTRLLQFCIGYTVNNETYWINNDTKNYAIEFLDIINIQQIESLGTKPRNRVLVLEVGVKMGEGFSQAMERRVGGWYKDSLRQKGLADGERGFGSFVGGFEVGLGFNTTKIDEGKRGVMRVLTDDNAIKVWIKYAVWPILK